MKIKSTAFFRIKLAFNHNACMQNSMGYTMYRRVYKQVLALYVPNAHVLGECDHVIKISSLLIKPKENCSIFVDGFTAHNLLTCV